MENAWQYAKVYSCHTNPNSGAPTQEYWKWAREGWNNPSPVRFPMGRGAKPEYSLWDSQRLGYIEARKKIYAPLCTTKDFSRSHSFRCVLGRKNRRLPKIEGIVQHFFSLVSL
jgi:hypothetical protein